jgi:hypothetical protein
MLTGDVIEHPAYEVVNRGCGGVYGGREARRFACNKSVRFVCISEGDARLSSPGHSRTSLQFAGLAGHDSRFPTADHRPRASPL